MQSQVLDAFFGARPDLTGAAPAPPGQEAKPLLDPKTDAPVPASGGTPAPQEPATPAPKKDDLGDLIRRGREEREARRQESAAVGEARTWRERAEAAEARLAKMDEIDPLADPIGWAVARGYTEEERAILGQAYLYDLVPEKAPPEFRIKLMEARQARREREIEARRREEAEAAQVEAGRALERQYEETLTSLIQHEATPAKVPVSSAWFGDDHDSWRASLVATARNMAESARAAGQRADLTPAKVAMVLEAELAKRAGRLPGRAEPQQRTPAPPVGDERVAATSTKGLNGNGTPRPPARNEAEAIQRAKDLLSNLPR